MTYILLLAPLLILIAISAITMRKVTNIVLTRHNQILNIPGNKQGYTPSSVVFNALVYFDESSQLVISIADLPFDKETLTKLGDEELNQLCNKRRTISRFTPLAIGLTVISIVAYSVYLVIAANKAFKRDVNFPRFSGQ